MEKYTGGTELQLGSAPHMSGRVVAKLVTVNNRTRLYGIPVANWKENSPTSWLFNGGLLYADLEHLEYATPECRNLADIALYEQAGLRIANGLVRLNALPGRPSQIVVANNTDHYGQTFAYHENYLAEDPASLIPSLRPFLVTRPIFAGAGMVLTKQMQQRLDTDNWYSIAQRSLATKISDYYKRLTVGDYSSFAGSSRHNSHLLHLTGGDANSQSSATGLKIGATALVQQTIEDGWQAPAALNISDAEVVFNLRRMALDRKFRWQYQTSRLILPAIVIQRVYLIEAKKRFLGRDEDTDWTLKMWEKTLNQLETDPLGATWLDWPLKYKLLSRYEEEGWTQEDLLRADLSFHAADPNLNILRLLGGSGINEDDLVEATRKPPQNTRAAGRGAAVKVLDRALGRRSVLPLIDWDSVSYHGGMFYINTPEPQKTYLKEADEFAKKLAAFVGR